jgi:hypothetical protein
MIDPDLGHYLSEDYAFCRRWRDIGGKVFVDVDCKLTHLTRQTNFFIGSPFPKGELTFQKSTTPHDIACSLIDRVAERLGESIDWLHDVANEMDAEDGVIWVYSLGDDGVMAFTDFGIENLVELTKIHKDQKPREGRRDLV